ncbi:redoxin domain-containing protein [Mesonia mobilis]|uniref:Thiol:disulfide interchange protein n=1 Tax=Mesonia mobilis TaxID=369791 RepID=A0ABQ3BN29_9FLAO|nr:redoxin domain-containing protein [Mesonia mobilis]MBQ0736917.1 redoxin domain-containing protein [Aquimarina celericrescens]GGZ51476.1 thiol:disulfide interchange protein [Mesonia mobilis]
MKKLFVIALAAFAVACQDNNKESNEPTFKGSISNVEDSTAIYLSQLGNTGQPQAIDTVMVKDGKFEIDLPKVDFETLNILTLEGGRGNVVFINENEPITATVYKDSLRSSKVEGGKSNQLFNDYVSEIMSLRKEMQKMVEQYQANNPNLRQNPALMQEIQQKQKELQENNTGKFQKMISENPQSLVSALILSDMMNGKSLSNNEFKELFENLDEEVKNSEIGKQLNETIQKASATAVGSKAPEFSAPTPEGEQLALKDALGKITIVDFWASWCKPCRIENPNVVKLYNEYHDKGLNIIGVSLDKNGQKDKWLKAIEDDGLTWQHVSNLQYWQGPVAQLYNVRSIPATFILDENGVIIAKDLRGEALRAKVSEMLD